MYAVAWSSEKYGDEWKCFDLLDEAEAEYKRVVDGYRGPSTLHSVSLCSVIHKTQMTDGLNVVSSIHSEFEEALAIFDKVINGYYEQVSSVSPRSKSYLVYGNRGERLSDSE